MISSTALPGAALLFPSSVVLAALLGGISLGCAADDLEQTPSCVEAPGSVGQWRPIPVSLETGEGELVAVWADTELLVWGGSSCGLLACATGARYDPERASWRTLPRAGARPRAMAAGVWTGSRLVVWGGIGNMVEGAAGYPMHDNGDVFEPSTETWSELEQSASPPPRRARHDAFFIPPNKLLLWGGAGANEAGETYGDFLIGGVLLDLESGDWTNLPERDAPSTIFGAVAWTGKELLVWGGVDRETRIPSTYGARFDPETMTWRPMSHVGAPVPHYGPAVWTGTELIVWGGEVLGRRGEQQPPGGAYDPNTDSWRPVSMQGAPQILSAGAVSTGREVVVWGGENDCPSGGVYDLATDSWRPTTLRGAPSPRSRFHTFWTGTEVLVYGGSEHLYDLRDGGLLRLDE